MSPAQSGKPGEVAVLADPGRSLLHGDSRMAGIGHQIAGRPSGATQLVHDTQWRGPGTRASTPGLPRRAATWSRAVGRGVGGSNTRRWVRTRTAPTHTTSLTPSGSRSATAPSSQVRICSWSGACRRNAETRTLTSTTSIRVHHVQQCGTVVQVDAGAHAAGREDLDPVRGDGPSAFLPFQCLSQGPLQKQRHGLTVRSRGAPDRARPIVHRGAAVSRRSDVRRAGEDGVARARCDLRRGSA